MSNRIAGLALGLAVAALAGAPASAAAAPAPTTVACGTTVTHSVTLATDIDCPATLDRPALTVATSHVTIDLNGHTLTVVPGSNGIHPGVGILDRGYDNVIVRDGSIENFSTAIRVSRASTVDLLGLHAGSFGGPIVLLTGSQHITMNGCQIEGDYATDVEADHVSASRFANSVFDTSFQQALILVGNHDVAFHDSTFTQLTSILVNGSADQIVDDIGPGVEVSAGNRDLIEGGQYGDPEGVAVLVDANAFDTTVQSVTADHSQGGIVSYSSTARLFDNTADDNFGYGIAAVPGVTARGNHATGNNNGGPQCVGVSCSS